MIWFLFGYALVVFVVAIVVGRALERHDQMMGGSAPDDILHLVPDMQVSSLVEHDTLPQAVLDELERSGYIGKASSWQEFMSGAGTHWITPAEFGDAFNAAVAKENAKDKQP